MSTIYSKELQQSNITVTLASMKFEGSKLRLELTCPTGEYEWRGVLISYAQKIEADRDEYFFEFDNKTVNPFETTIHLTIDLDAIEFKSTNWNVNAVYALGGEDYKSPIIYKARYVTYRDLFFPKDRYVKNGFILSPYPMRGGFLGLRYRQKNRYDSLGTRIKETIALLIYNFKKKKYRDKQIYLIYEKRCAKAMDNAYYLFKYCMDNDMEQVLGREIYYVIERDSADYAKLKPYERNVLKFASVKHMLYLLSARLLISSDSRAHAYIWQPEVSVIAPLLTKKRHIFLGHGVLALKRLNDSFLAKRMNSVMATVTSEDERDIVVDHLGFKRHDAPITGYARFDALVDKSDDYNEILIMPTHRSWLFGVDREAFTSSEYYERYTRILKSPELNAILKERGMTAKFYLHPSIGEHLDTFTESGECVEIVKPGEYAIDELMMRCKLLITDYSSICWDVYYMGKPILFYQYDEQDYLDTWGSYIELSKDSPGMISKTYDELISHFTDAAERGFELDENWAERREEHYQFIDTDNCKRICEALKERNL